jgi:hypothetical protein
MTKLASVLLLAALSLAPQVYAQQAQAGSQGAYDLSVLTHNNQVLQADDAAINQMKNQMIYAIVELNSGICEIEWQRKPFWKRLFSHHRHNQCPELAPVPLMISY